METTFNEIGTLSSTTPKLGKAFWVIWGIELWERFGYYGAQAILTLYFVSQLGYTESQSFYVFGSFSAFVYGFIWIGGWLGDKYLGAKHTLALGAITLMLAYSGLALSNHHSIFYALAGIVVGNALFKANPSSLISKMYKKGDPALDSAMTLYYMAINIGSMVAMALTPIIAQNYGWTKAFWLCAIGLLLGLGNYFIYNPLLNTAKLEQKKLNLKRLATVIIVALLSILLVAQLLNHTKLCNEIVYTVVTCAFFYFIKTAFLLKEAERTRMLVAFILILQAVLFFVLYNQMPTSLTFFALHNIDNHVFGWVIPPAEYQVLNSIVIVAVSPILAQLYKKCPSTHVTKFCIGMSCCAAAFLVLAIPQFTTTTGIASPIWMLLTYFLQSTGELLISGLGLAMVAELCPENISGFVMGIWWLSMMLAGPIGAWVGTLTTLPSNTKNLSAIASMHLYGDVFFKIGLITTLVAILMWVNRPLLNKLLK